MEYKFIRKSDGAVFNKINSFPIINPQDIPSVKPEVPIVEPYRIDPKETPIYEEVKQLGEKVVDVNTNIKQIKVDLANTERKRAEGENVFQKEI